MKEQIENLLSDFIIAYAEENELGIEVLRTRIYKTYMSLEISTKEVLEISDMLFEGIVQ
jgi:hypothetical protein